MLIRNGRSKNYPYMVIIIFCSSFMSLPVLRQHFQSGQSPMHLMHSFIFQEIWEAIWKQSSKSSHWWRYWISRSVLFLSYEGVNIVFTASHPPQFYFLAVFTRVQWVVLQVAYSMQNFHFYICNITSDMCLTAISLSRTVWTSVSRKRSYLGAIQKSWSISSNLAVGYFTSRISPN